MGYLVFVKDLVKAYKELVDGPQKQLQELTNLKHALPVDFLS